MPSRDQNCQFLGIYINEPLCLWVMSVVRTHKTNSSLPCHSFTLEIFGQVETAAIPVYKYKYFLDTK